MAKAKKGTTKATGRDYSYDSNYESTPDQIAKRVKRNQARADMIKSKGADAVKGKDVNHIKPLANGGSNSPSNLNIESKAVNRARKPRKKKG